MRGKRMRFESLAMAIEFVNAVAEVADDANHQALKLDRCEPASDGRWGLLLGLRTSLNERRRPTSK
jgi:hypothetical protein